LIRPRMLAVAAGCALAAGASVGVVDMAGHGTHDHPAPPERPVRTAVIAAQWAYRPASVGALARKAPVAVIARVRTVRPGPPLADDPYVAPTPTERVTVFVERRLYGRAPDRIEIFKTGSRTEWIEGDPPYAVGERYLLFVRPHKPGGGWLPVAPDGRLRLSPEGLAPLTSGAVGRALARRPLGAAEDLTRQARKEAR
jgi:hypothetical protein